MSESNKVYWEKRQVQKFLSGEKMVSDYYRDLKKSFEQSKREIESVIHDFVMRFGTENEMPSYADALQKLNEVEIGDLQAFIDKANENMGKYNLELNNMSIRARITRYQALEKQIDVILQQLYGIEYQYKGEETLKGIYSNSYYRTWFNLDQYFGFHAEFAQVSAKTVEELIRYPFDGANFSDRIWKQKAHLLQQLNESVTTMLIQGRNPRELAGEFSKKFVTKEYEAYRLLHTEASFIIEQGTQAAYKEDGIEKYRWLATLDIHTCERCQERDNKTEWNGEPFIVGKGVVGKTLPPLHPFDRCTTIPVIGDEDEDEEETRAARDLETGKTHFVPADMSYKDWHKIYIENNPEAVLKEKKIKNLATDKPQYDEYISRLGKEYVPKSLDAFQDIKYKNPDEYGIIKAQFKGMSYYDKAIANEPEITAHVKKVAKDTKMDVAGLEYRVKGKDSYLRKIRSRYSPDGNEYEVKDIIRYTYTSDPDSVTEKTIKAIEIHRDLGYNTIDMKNYWMKKKDPYNGINTTVQSPSGQKFELQYHTPESFDLKNGELHRLYEKQRLIQDRTSEEYIKLDDEMFELSDKLTVPRNIERVK